MKLEDIKQFLEMNANVPFATLMILKTNSTFYFNVLFMHGLEDHMFQNTFTPIQICLNTYITIMRRENSAILKNIAWFCDVSFKLQDSLL